ncbi:MAG: winged helix-turn-helix domain-containing protein [Nitrososphaerales archaeon]
MMDSTFENVTEQTPRSKNSLLLSPTSGPVPSSPSPFYLQRVEQLLARNEVRMLFRALEERKIDRIRPHLTETGALVYLEVAKVTEIGAPQISEILEDLAREDILIKEPASPLFKCPGCNSTIAAQSFVCPNCHGTELISGAALQHLSCLNFDFESNFEHRDGFTFCPKCDRKLLNLGSDYLRPGTFFKCTVCCEFTARALRLCTCSSCHKVFETTKEAAIQAFEYKINDKKKEVIARYLMDADFHPLFDALKLTGFEARKSNILEGKSGVYHSFTIVANYQGIEDERNLVVIDAIATPVWIDAAPVLSLFAKALDCKVKNRILVAVPELDDDARALARNYNISYIEAKHRPIEETAEKLQIMLKGQVVHQAGLTKDGDLAGKSYQLGKIAKRQAVRKRSSLDIMTDILRVVSAPSSKTEIMSCANLSYDQCQKYLPALEKLGLMREYFEDGVHSRFAITEKGLEYLSNMSAEFGRIAEGDKSVWSTRRRAESHDNRITQKT